MLVLETAERWLITTTQRLISLNHWLMNFGKTLDNGNMAFYNQSGRGFPNTISCFYCSFYGEDKAITLTAPAVHNPFTYRAIFDISVLYVTNLLSLLCTTNASCGYCFWSWLQLCKALFPKQEFPLGTIKYILSHFLCVLHCGRIVPMNRFHILYHKLKACLVSECSMDLELFFLQLYEL